MALGWSTPAHTDSSATRSTAASSWRRSAGGWVTASPPAIVLAGALLGLFRLKSAREEAWLSEAYPGYDSYARRTRRFIPFVY